MRDMAQRVVTVDIERTGMLSVRLDNSDDLCLSLSLFDTQIDVMATGLLAD